MKEQEKPWIWCQKFHAFLFQATCAFGKMCIGVYPSDMRDLRRNIIILKSFYPPPPLNVLLHLAPFLAMNLMIVMFAPEKLIYSLNSKAVP